MDQQQMTIKSQESDEAAYPDTSAGSPAESSDVAQNEDIFVLPASFAQQRLWFLEQWEPGVYNINLAVQLLGQADLPAIERSIQAIVQRHEILRTTFTMQGSQLFQVVVPALSVLLTQVDLTPFPQDVQSMKLRRVIKEDSQQTFDLMRGPLLRISVLKQREDKHTLLFCMHHIISDGWSMEVFLHEFKALYVADVHGEPSPLADLEIQYADYAMWQKDWLQGEALEEQMEYWRQQLADVPTLQLPLDHVRPAIQTFRGSLRPIFLSTELNKALNALCRRANVTPFMLLLAVFQTLLYRYSGQSAIAVGTPIAGRVESKLEPLIGCFINTLVLATKFEDELTFWELLKRVREVALGSYEHQDIPFERLVEELQPERNISHNPLTQVMFALQNVPQSEIELPGVQLKSLNAMEHSILNSVGNSESYSAQKHRVMSENKTAMFDLDLTLWERGEEIFGEIKYNTDLFEPATIDRLHDHFLILLQNVIANPHQAVGVIPLLAEKEEQQLLQEWNSLASASIRPASFMEGMWERVRLHPDTFAVSDEHERLTYIALWQRAQYVARVLQAHGIAAEQLVGLYSERTVAWSVAILGIMLAGGVYVPLDPRYPQARLKQMVSQSRPRLLLVSQEQQAWGVQVLHELQEKGANSELLILQSLLAEQRDFADETEIEGPGWYAEQQLAYVIYTSGSTGVPKGVLVEQRGMLNHLSLKLEELQVQSEDIVAQTASACFDISIWQLLTPWLAGAEVRIYVEEVVWNAEELLRQVVRDGVSILEVVPSWLETLLAETQQPVATGALRCLLATGEALKSDLAGTWLQRYPSIPLLNAYGPSECSDDVTHHIVSSLQECEGRNQQVPIGHALANLSVYVLDAHLAPQPIGVIGELYVGGMGVGRGYLYEPEKTAAVFLPDPLSTQAGARLYRTGDLGRYRADGVIEFCGRIDEQVKLHGYRIELGEIEHILRQQAGIQECRVLKKTNAGGVEQLVAYIQKEQQVEDQERIAAAFSVLRESVPEYMVPTAVVFVESMPLTANGKVDKQRLLALNIDDTFHDQAAYVAARTPLEKHLAALWTELLGVQLVGMHDDFFMLGGHSLLTVRLMKRIEEDFGVRLSLATIFQGRTIESLAYMLHRHSIGSSLTTHSDIQVDAAVDLLADATLESTICPEVWVGDLKIAPAHVLLTGATGTLGCALLADLLTKTSVYVYCLVRTTSPAEGEQKLWSLLLESGIVCKPEWRERIHGILGDLSQPLLGLTSAQFLHLAETVDTIYHSGAFVNMVYPYTDLKPANVLGTKEVIRLATTHHIKALHYVSTLSVFPHKGETLVQHVREQESLDEFLNYVHGGYAQSKWVAEKIVTIARSRGLPVVIYRPGRISGDSRSGVWRTNDVFCLLIKICIMLGNGPIMTENDTLEMTPVDYVSGAIVGLSLRKASLGQSFHLYNAAHGKVNDIVGWLNSFGYDVQPTEYTRWYEAVARICEEEDAGATNEGFSGVLLELPTPDVFQLQAREGRATRVEAGYKNTHLALKRLAVTCPPLDEHLLHTYLHYLVQCGFLPVPTRKM